MTLAVLRSRALAGLAAPEVTVEVHLAAGLPSFTLVGLPDTEVKEARDRVRAAIQNCGFEFPQRRITVNLAPADLPKESGRFDLPIALGILVASEQIKAAGLDAHEFAGELALSGDLRAVRGTLAMCAAIRHEAGPRYDTGHATGHNAARAFVLPLESAPEAALIEGMEILPAQNLLQVCAHLAGREMLAPFAVPPAPTSAALDAEWCGARNGRWFQCARRKVPASECTAADSSASAWVIGGSRPGRRCASIDLPAPGGPLIRIECPPAAATSSARLAWAWPLTSARSG